RPTQPPLVLTDERGQTVGPLGERRDGTLPAEHADVAHGAEELRELPAHRALRDPDLIDDPMYRLLVSRSLAGEAIFTTSDGMLTTAIRGGEVDRDAGRLHAIPAFKVRQPDSGDPSLVQNLADQSSKELGGDAGARVADQVTASPESVRVFLLDQHSSPASDGNVAIGMHAQLDVTMEELLRSQGSRGVEGNLHPLPAEHGAFIPQVTRLMAIPDFEGTLAAATLAGSFGPVREQDARLVARLARRSLDGDPRLEQRLEAMQRTVPTVPDRDHGDAGHGH
ncbi:MAG TPA: hypothetical protein VIA06_11970, partial [Candidatus Dormibacteraeota bacterium]|nr:hypothetical protein [Candidatus Dormibacteraeota bacterium]